MRKLYLLRPGTDTIFHTHSVLAVLASLMEAGQVGEFSVSHLQMVKAMPGHKWSDRLRLPIINNQDTEDGIAVELEAAVRDNPGVDALLIRGHGLYVWASSWRAAKVKHLCKHCMGRIYFLQVRVEALEWIFHVCVEMKKMGLR